MDEGLDLDFHVDESEDPAVRSLRHIADAALRHKFPGRINVGHCCSLALQPREEAEETMKRVRDAGISVVSLPMCNLYLQDRHAGRTPRWRGVTLLHEMKALGIPVAVASDNTRDPFYAYGDLDALEVFREAVRILHFDHPFGNWPGVVARDAADNHRQARARQPSRPANRPIWFSAGRATGASFSPARSPTGPCYAPENQSIGHFPIIVSSTI